MMQKDRFEEWKIWLEIGRYKITRQEVDENSFFIAKKGGEMMSIKKEKLEKWLDELWKEEF